MSFTSPLYDYSIPLFVRQLEQLLAVLKKGEAWCETNNVDKSKLLEGKLAEDMLVRRTSRLHHLLYTVLTVDIVLIASNLPNPNLQQYIQGDLAQDWRRRGDAHGG